MVLCDADLPSLFLLFLNMLNLSLFLFAHLHWITLFFTICTLLRAVRTSQLLHCEIIDVLSDLITNQQTIKYLFNCLNQNQVNPKEKLKQCCGYILVQVCN